LCLTYLYEKQGENNKAANKTFLRGMHLRFLS
jgi:hypothetical protein